MEDQVANTKNAYLDQVMAQQEKLEADLRAKRAGTPPASPVAPRLAGARAAGSSAERFQAAEAVGGERRNAVDVRLTGFWRWKSVLVPPNAYVVHTRRGRPEPVHLGLGVSFRFDPFTDAYLVAPGATQTILINAYCICQELQGLLVQGYVQWIIQDFGTAYKKLDFSDAEDPMRLVNLQLREQAEAAIKDKVATMGIDEVLSDKQPIIEELTARLRHVAEGAGGTDTGLGLRIVTVQIKEAVVSSTRLWENLQQPFRAERARIARLAELAAEAEIRAKELEHRRRMETDELETQARLDALRAVQEAARFDRERAEQARRHAKEQELARQAAAEQNETALAGYALEKVRADHEAELARAKQREQLEQQRTAAEAAIALEEARRAMANRQTAQEIEFLEARQRIANAMTDANLQGRLLETLPAVAEKLPKPVELKSVAIGGPGTGAAGADALGGLIAQVLAVVDALKPNSAAPPPPAPTTGT